MAKSLMEGMDTPAASKKSSGSGGQGGKLVFAVVLFLIAGVVVAWSQGWIFASKPDAIVETPEQRAAQQKAFDEQQKHTQQQIQQGKAQIGGSS